LPRVFLSRAVSEALVVGFWRPIVLVPAAWASDMPLVVLEAIVAHELAHIRRFDLWVNLLQRLVEALLFYHPAVWWVSRQLRLEREMCCDELAVAATGRRVEYAETLELVARERLAGVRPALAAGIRGESNMKLLARVKNVLGGPAGETGGLWPAGVLAVLLPLGLWAVTWGVLSPAPAAAVAADDNDADDDGNDDGDDRKERADDGDRRERGKDREDDDDDDEGEVRKKGDKERQGEEARDKKELLREFLERKEDREERKEGDAPKKERKEGDAPKKERKDGDEPKKIRKVGEQPKKVIKEGDQPRKVIKEGEGERKESIKKEVFRKDGEAPVKKPALKEGGEKRGDFAELAALVKELRGEVDRLRAEVRELRGGKPLRDEGAEKLPRIKAEAAESKMIIKKVQQDKAAPTGTKRRPRSRRRSSRNCSRWPGTRNEPPRRRLWRASSGRSRSARRQGTRSEPPTEKPLSAKSENSRSGKRPSAEKTTTEPSNVERRSLWHGHCPKAKGRRTLDGPFLRRLPRGPSRGLLAHATGRRMPPSRLIRNNTRNTTNSTWAIQVAVPATPPKPSAAATSATIKKTNAQ
jgi:hypothetical protein